MKIKTKHYKLAKIKFYYKNEKVLFLFDTYNLNTKNWLELEQKLKNLNLKYYKIFNIITKIFLKNTIFKNLKTTINGPLKLISLKDQKTLINIKEINKILSNFQLCNVKLNHKLYSKSQIKNLEFLNYKTNLYTFNKTLKNFLTVNSLKLIKNSKQCDLNT